MRLWSIHPKYLDPKGLVALWREALLAQKVLLGETRGYKNHPQLVRFKNTRNPVGAVAVYLRIVAEEAQSRGYQFDRSKIAGKRFTSQIAVTSGQVDHEIQHLLRKLKTRDPQRFAAMQSVKRFQLNPLFHRVSGAIEDWESMQDTV